MKRNLWIAGLILLGGWSTIYAQTSVPAPKMVYVEGGTFVMGNDLGSADERPKHTVTVNSFFIGKFEVTFKDFKQFVDATGFVTDAEQTDTVNPTIKYPRKPTQQDLTTARIASYAVVPGAATLRGCA